MPVDCAVANVLPSPGWALVRERFDKGRDVTIAGIKLEVVDPKRKNTVYGELVAVHPDDPKAAEVNPGEVVIYREWEGRRWDFRGETVLVMGSEHILATAE